MLFFHCCFLPMLSLLSKFRSSLSDFLDPDLVSKDGFRARVATAVNTADRCFVCMFEFDR